MKNSIVTLGLYFEVKDSELYGGEGSIGYANVNIDLKISVLENTDISNCISEQIKGLAEMCHVDIEKIRVISRTEYEENTEEDTGNYSDWLD